MATVGERRAQQEGDSELCQEHRGTCTREELAHVLAIYVASLIGVGYEIGGPAYIAPLLIGFHLCCVVLLNDADGVASEQQP